MSYFEHNTLESPAEQIRLIQLLPRHCNYKDSFKGAEASQFAHGSAFPKGHEIEPTLIRCTINHVSLKDKVKPKYTALSYTWGAPEQSHRIMINDAYFKVTESLEIMLQHIQSSTETLTLWIDQLCINQRDLDEKNAQVPRMKEIYREALQTIVWLGPATDDSDQIMGFLADVGREAYEFDLLQLTLAELRNWSDESKQDERLRNIRNSLNLLLERIGPTLPVEAFANLIARHWFSRVWVVQEVSLGKDVIFKCGEKKLSYDHLRAAIFFHTFYIRNITSNLQTSFADLDENGRILTALSLIDTSPIGSMLLARRKYQTQTGNKGESLYDLLKRHHTDSTEATKLKATDPRDMIYGLFGLASDFEELDIQADYKESCTEVYTDVARKLIKHGHVDLLAMSQDPKTLTSADGIHLPSWVPDWTGTILKPCGEVSELSTPFSASGTSRVAVVETHQFGTAPGMVGLEGVRVDQVELVSTVLKLSSGGILVFLEEVGKFCQESARKHNNIYRQSQRQTEAIWRVPIGDKEFSSGGYPPTCRATAKSGQGYEIILRNVTMVEQLLEQEMAESQAAGSLQTSSVPTAVSMSNESETPLITIMKDMKNPDVVSYMAMMDDMQNRRPFMSIKGYVGLGPAHLQPGDIICVLLGARVPYILRPHENGGFVLVGEAYCDSIMDGEIMEGNPRMETFIIS